MMAKWKGGFVFLIKKKAGLFGGHILITFIIWNTDVKVERSSEWLKVLLAPEPDRGAEPSLGGCLHIKRDGAVKAARTQLHGGVGEG